MTQNSEVAVVARLAELAAIGRHSAGINRPLATAQERAARELFVTWARADGYALTQDRVGNLFARRAGTLEDAVPILVGSHLDTVQTGGPYDGAYGVVGALCALELLDSRRAATAHPVEAVAWVGEEGSRFPFGCLGSSVFAGLMDVDAALALVDGAGTSLRAALAAPNGGLLREVASRVGTRAAAYLELHIEQGPLLERAGIPLGVVTAIVAQRRYQVIVEGTSGHAGTVPMDQRRDALCAASELILALEAVAKSAGDSVVTVGRIAVEPNGTNVIPARVTFSVDARSPDERRIDAIEQAFQATSLDAQRQRGVRVTMEQLESRAAVPMDPILRQALCRAVESLGEHALEIPSGAGHDAMCLASIAPSAMLLVPSIGGRSHVADERTADADLKLGVAALAASILEVDRSLHAK